MIDAGPPSRNTRKRERANARRIASKSQGTNQRFNALPDPHSLTTPATARSARHLFRILRALSRILGRHPFAAPHDATTREERINPIPSTPVNACSTALAALPSASFSSQHNTRRNGCGSIFAKLPVFTADFHRQAASGASFAAPVATPDGPTNDGEDTPFNAPARPFHALVDQDLVGGRRRSAQPLTLRLAQRMRCLRKNPGSRLRTSGSVVALSRR